jgi:prevent-host-death family protein
MWCNCVRNVYTGAMGYTYRHVSSDARPLKVKRQVSVTPGQVVEAMQQVIRTMVPRRADLDGRSHRRVNARAAREQLAELMEAAFRDDERIVITRHGRPFAALVSVDALADYEFLEDERDAAAVRQAIQADSGERYPLAEVMADVLADDRPRAAS